VTWRLLATSNSRNSVELCPSDRCSRILRLLRNLKIHYHGRNSTMEKPIMGEVSPKKYSVPIYLKSSVVSSQTTIKSR